MKHKLRYFAIGIILCSLLCVPLIYFQLLDQRDLLTNKEWSGKQNNKELIENHPVVQGLYTSFYGEDNEKRSYDIQNLSQYDEEQLSLLHPIINSFEKEINTLLDMGIIKKEHLKLSSDEQFKIPFGALSISMNKTGTHFLNMAYSLENGYVESATFTLDKNSYKLLAFTITNPKVEPFTTKQKYKLFRKFNKYLDLEDIKDWSEMEGSLISYQLRAELHIDEIREDKTKSFTLSVMPMGVNTRMQVGFY